MRKVNAELSGRPNQTISRLPAFLCAALALSVWSCGQNPGKITVAAGSARIVKTVPAEFRPMERTITVTGSFNARERATLSVKVPGRLEKIEVDVGSVVKKGDLLAQIEREDYELHVRQAEATLAQARARLGLASNADDDKIDLEKTPVVQQAKALLGEAQKNRDRVIELTKEKIASAAELDSVEAAYTVALGKYQDALQDVRERQALLVQRRAELEVARKQLFDSTILSPFDGIVQQRRASLGEFLAMGTPLLVVATIDPLRLQLQIPERESSHVAPDQPIRVTVGGSTNIFSAQLDRVSPMLSESNRMLVAEADVPATPALRPGLFAQAVIVIKTNDPALGIPESAVTSFIGLEKAFVIKDGVAVEKGINTGRRERGYVEVLSGIGEGERVIVDAEKIRAGQPVTEEADAKAR